MDSCGSLEVSGNEHSDATHRDLPRSRSGLSPPSPPQELPLPPPRTARESNPQRRLEAECPLHLPSLGMSHRGLLTALMPDRQSVPQRDHAGRPKPKGKVVDDRMGPSGRLRMSLPPPGTRASKNPVW